MTLNAFQNDQTWLEGLIHHNSDWIWEVDEKGRYTFCSERVTAILGLSPTEVLGRSPFDFMPPEEADRVGKIFQDIATTRRPFSGLINRNIHADGKIVVLETSGVPLFDREGTFLGYRGIDRDISALGERVLHLEDVYKSAPVALFTVNRDGNIVMANEAMGLIAGRPHDNLTGVPLSSVLVGAADQLAADFATADDGAQLSPYEFQHGDRWLYGIPQVLRDISGTVAGLSIGWLDITARKMAERSLQEANRQLEHYANRDYLTGLYNRRYLDERFEAEIARSRRDLRPLSVCMVDVDHFKSYNDALSHLEGDRCLKEIADTLAAAARRPGDVVGRYGGEEFVLLLSNTDDEGAVVIAERIRAAIEVQNWRHPESPFGVVTVSLGVVTYHPSLGERLLSTLDLLHAADEALYAAKRAGRNNVMRFDSATMSYGN